MRSGTMRDVVTLLVLVPATDPRWGTVEEWQEVASPWANVTPLDGTEAVVDKGVQSEISHTITMRYRSDVTSANRITYRGQTLEILSAIDPDGKRRQLVIQAKLYPGVS
jgi:SPP1 family predicted phage head-tail adaptor